MPIVHNTPFCVLRYRESLGNLCSKSMDLVRRWKRDSDLHDTTTMTHAPTKSIALARLNRNSPRRTKSSSLKSSSRRKTPSGEQPSTTRPGDRCDAQRGGRHARGWDHHARRGRRGLQISREGVPAAGPPSCEILGARDCVPLLGASHRLRRWFLPTGAHRHREKAQLCSPELVAIAERHSCALGRSSRSQRGTVVPPGPARVRRAALADGAEHRARRQTEATPELGELERDQSTGVPRGCGL